MYLIVSEMLLTTNASDGKAVRSVAECVPNCDVTCTITHRNTVVLIDDSDVLKEDLSLSVHSSQVSSTHISHSSP